MVVDRHRMVAENESDVGALRGDDFAYSTDPDRAVHHADALHFIHQTFWESLGYRAFSQPSPFGVRIQNIEVLKKRLEVLVPFAHIGAGKCTHRLGAPTVDITEQAPKSDSKELQSGQLRPQWGRKPAFPAQRLAVRFGKGPSNVPVLGQKGSQNVSSGNDGVGIREPSFMA
nr:hypothetical protein [Sinorhizobium meliloti]